MKLFVLLLLVSSQAAALGCPAEIHDRQALVKSSTAWEVKTESGPRYLESAMVFEGHPSKFKFIKPTRITDSGLIWSFSNKKEIWLQCDYSRSATSVIVQVGRVTECNYYKKHPVVSGGAFLSCKS